MVEKMTAESDSKKAGEKVHCQYRDLPSRYVFGFTERPCMIRVAKGSDFCVCPWSDQDWHTCPYGKELGRESGEK